MQTQDVITSGTRDHTQILRDLQLSPKRGQDPGTEGSLLWV